MINPDIYGKKILDTFLNTHNHKSTFVENKPGAETQYLGKIDPDKRNRVSFKSSVYIGLLNAMPERDAENALIGWAEPSAAEYRRFKLTKTSPTLPDNTPILKSGITESPVEVETTLKSTGETVSDYVFAAYVANQDNIVFPRVEEGNADAWNGTNGIVGFALFSSEDKDEVPFMWGDIKPLNNEESMVLKPDQIPIIRPGGFKITMI